MAAHTWQDYRCESRLVFSAAPRIAPVVLVGGAFQTKENWGDVEAEFLTHADVLAVDLPGWGKAGVLPERYGVDFLADALCRILDDTGLTEVNLVGCSYGTAVTYTFAQRHPGRVRRMALIGTTASVPEHARDSFHRGLGLLAAERMEEFADEALDQLMNRGALDRTVAGHRIRRFLHTRLARLRPDEAQQLTTNTRRLLTHRGLDLAAAPTMPVLVTTGEHDHYATPALGQELAAACPDGWFTVITDADHMLPLERGREVSDLCLRFFADRPLTDLAYCPDGKRVSRQTTA
ncbi:alpha/beta fold hydrolase [Streptacidiphilus pinicola]|uniref:alpha/beta fold hydrolase n=1 Tax=Streptacidiphilus pinicola TaxID=2219663 RepID=UPI001403937C|nr:alpha/beta hydrolase [Streptacidiphilus pinicola]